MACHSVWNSFYSALSHSNAARPLLFGCHGFIYYRAVIIVNDGIKSRFHTWRRMVSQTFFGLLGLDISNKSSFTALSRQLLMVIINHAFANVYWFTAEPNFVFVARWRWKSGGDLACEKACVHWLQGDLKPLLHNDAKIENEVFCFCWSEPSTIKH